MYISYLYTCIYPIYIHVYILSIDMYISYLYTCIHISTDIDRCMHICMCICIYLVIYPCRTQLYTRDNTFDDTHVWMMMSHVWMSYVTRVNEACQACESCHTCELVMTHAWHDSSTRVKNSKSVPFSVSRRKQPWRNSKRVSFDFSHKERHSFQENDSLCKTLKEKNKKVIVRFKKSTTHTHHFPRIQTLRAQNRHLLLLLKFWMRVWETTRHLSPFNNHLHKFLAFDGFWYHVCHPCCFTKKIIIENQVYSGENVM